MDGKPPPALMDFRDLQDSANAAIMGAFKERSPATYSRAGEDPVEIGVTLSYPSEVVEQGGMTQVIAAKVPVIELVLADLEPLEPKKGDVIELLGSTYKVNASHPDGFGMTRLEVQVTA